MPPYDATGEIGPVGRLDSQHTIDRCTTYTSDRWDQCMYAIEIIRLMHGRLVYTSMHGRLTTIVYNR